MQILRYVLRNITVLNITLLVSLLLLAYYAVLPLLDMNIQLALPSLKKTETEDIAPTSQAQTPMLADYMLIADQNLFHPERKIPEKKEEKQLPKPEFVLYGTLISDDTSIAYMEDMKAPHNTAGRGKRQKAIQKGAMLSGFTLSEIYHDKVVMIRGDEKVEIKITDQQHKKARGTGTTSSIAEGKSSDPASQEIKGAVEQSPKGRVQVRSSPSAGDRRKQIDELRTQRESRRNNLKKE